MLLTKTCPRMEHIVEQETEGVGFDFIVTLGSTLTSDRISDGDGDNDTLTPAAVIQSLGLRGVWVSDQAVEVSSSTSLLL